MHIERRSKARYPIELALSYQTLEPAKGVTGNGRSLNMSSGGLLILSPVRLARGTLLKVTLEWPSLLDGITPLQFVTVGRVARCDESSFAMTFENYQFRTMRRKTSILAAAGALADLSGAGQSGEPGRPDAASANHPARVSLFPVS